jgi:hypothetical protein
MAARKKRGSGTGSLSESWRERIQGGVLINRLTQHANGKVEMTATQVKAAEILLKKALPDLSNHQVTGAEGGPVIVRWKD